MTSENLFDLESIISQLPRASWSSQFFAGRCHQGNCVGGKCVGEGEEGKGPVKHRKSMQAYQRKLSGSMVMCRLYGQP